MKNIVITKEQIKNFQEVIKRWEATGYMKQDKEMVECYRKDRADLREVVSLLKRGKFEEAGSKICFLDTVVRDVVPDDIYRAVVN